MLPNFLIIGAPKAGTTSLHAYLDRHPDIHMSQPKELYYFDDPAYESRREWYESHFESDLPLRGEATPHYAMYPYYSGVPERIHRLIPDAKLIYLVRDPIEQILSHCVQLYTNGYCADAAELLADAEREDNPGICASRYATQLQQYLRFFDPAQLLVVDQRDLKVEREETMAEILRFLGADPDSAAVSFEDELNARADKYEYTRTGELLWSRLLSPVGRAVVPMAVRNRIRRRVTDALPNRRVESPKLTDDVRSRLLPSLEAEVAWLRSFSGKRFATWQV
jgi:Sulfotransferase family